MRLKKEWSKDQHASLPTKDRGIENVQGGEAHETENESKYGRQNRIRFGCVDIACGFCSFAFMDDSRCWC
jgi:hypothetical protein